MDRIADARWNGELKSGNGTIKLGSGAFEGPYSFASRFEDGTGTNPEEMIGGAHAACFSMALANSLAQAGHKPTSVATRATVHLGKNETGFAIVGIDLATRGTVPGIDLATFTKFAEETKTGCIISKALKAVPMTLKVELLKA